MAHFPWYKIDAIQPAEAERAAGAEDRDHKNLNKAFASKDRFPWSIVHFHCFALSRTDALSRLSLSLSLSRSVSHTLYFKSKRI